MFNDSNHGDVQALCFHPGASLFAAAGADGIVRTYDLRKPYSDCVFTTAHDNQDKRSYVTQPSLGTRKAVLSMCFSTHARTLYTCHAFEFNSRSSWCTWDAYTGDFIRDQPAHTHWTTSISSTKTPPAALAASCAVHSAAEYVMTSECAPPRRCIAPLRPPVSLLRASSAHSPAVKPCCCPPPLSLSLSQHHATARCRCGRSSRRACGICNCV